MLDTKRHDTLFDCRSFDLPVNIVGVGGVGSHVARLLAKLGVGRNSVVSIFDGDRVEPHNLANQAYDQKHIGSYKTEALSDQYSRWSGGVEVTSSAHFVEDRTPLSGVVFLCLDNMEARKNICERSIWRNPEVKLLVETRTSVAHAMVYALDPNRERHIECWNAYWYPSDKADNDLGCNGPVSIITSVELTALFAVQSFLDFARSGSVDGLVNRFSFDLNSREVMKRETW